MRSARALFASIGTGVMLVAAVTFSLLSVSAVFALGGFEGADDATAGEALVLDLQGRSGSNSASSSRTAKAPAVAVVRRQARPPRRTVARRPSRRPDTVRANTASARTPTAGASQVASLDQSTTSRPPVAQQAAPPAVAKKPAPNLGDGVKKLGDDLSAGVQQTGTKLAEITAPLGPVVSTSVQQVLNLVAALVKGTTDGLGALLGARP